MTPANNGGNGVGRCGEFLQYDFTPRISRFLQRIGTRTLSSAAV